MRIVESHEIPATGVGRKDHSRKIEYSIEPVVDSSFQQEFSIVHTTNVTAGATHVYIYTFSEDLIMVVEDFTVSGPAHGLYRGHLHATTLPQGTYPYPVVAICQSYGYGKVSREIPPAYALLSPVYIAMVNYIPKALDLTCSLTGHYLSYERYHMELS